MLSLPQSETCIITSSDFECTESVHLFSGPASSTNGILTTTAVTRPRSTMHQVHDPYQNRSVYFNPNNTTAYPPHTSSTSPPNYQPHNGHLPLLQSRSTQSHSGTEFSSILGAINHDILDDFQIQLFQILHRGNDQSVASYFSKKSTTLYRFLIELYIVSLNESHPVRCNSTEEADFLMDFQHFFQIPLTRNDSYSSKSVSFAPDLGYHDRNGMNGMNGSVPPNPMNGVNPMNGTNPINPINGINGSVPPNPNMPNMANIHNPHTNMVRSQSARNSIHSHRPYQPVFQRDLEPIPSIDAFPAASQSVPDPQRVNDNEPEESPSLSPMKPRLRYSQSNKSLNSNTMSGVSYSNYTNPSNHNPHSNPHTFTPPPDAMDITFDPPRNGQPTPRRTRAGGASSPRSNWQQNYHSVHNAKSTPSFNFNPPESHTDQLHAKSTNGTGNSNSGATARSVPQSPKQGALISNNKRQSQKMLSNPSTAANALRNSVMKLSRSKSALAVRNMVKRKSVNTMTDEEEQKQKEKTIFVENGMSIRDFCSFTVDFHE